MIEMIEKELLQIGVAGIFIIYLIWENQSLKKLFSKLEGAIDRNTKVIEELCLHLKN